MSQIFLLGEKRHLLKASLNAIIISSGYTFLSSQILKIRSTDFETDGSLKRKKKTDIQKCELISKSRNLKIKLSTKLFSKYLLMFILKFFF